MKQLLSLFLFLLPCLAWAQYPSNGNQKITLGEQTTADGLIWRGVLVDTGIITPLSDTSAYIILDTVNHRFYNYNRATNVWSVAGGGTAVTTFSAGTTGLTPNTATSGAVTLGGTLGLASGGTGGTSYASGNVIYSNGTALTSDTSLFWDSTNKILSIGKKTILSTNIDLQVGGKGNRARFFILAPNANDYTQMIFGHGTAETGQYAEFIRNNTNKEFIINNINGDFLVSTKLVSSAYRNDLFIESDNGKVGIGTQSPSEALHVVGNARITAMNGINDIGASATGVLQAATSDMNLKNTIENSPFGLNEILLLNPVTFLYNDTDRKIDSDVKEVGFIAQDVFDVIPNAVSSTGTSDLQLDYRAITATLVKAIQEQQALIKALEQRIINLENK